MQHTSKHLVKHIWDLVEVGVGLIPGGGGNKELYMKHLKDMPKGVEFDFQYVANKVFETIAMAKVSTSAEEARENQLLKLRDGILVSMVIIYYMMQNNESLPYMTKAINHLLEGKVPVVGETGYATLLLGAQAMYLSGAIFLIMI